MPRYFFNVYDGQSSIDKAGTELPDGETAQFMAVKLAGEILRDEADRLMRDQDWRLEVLNASGDMVYEIQVDLRVHDL